MREGPMQIILANELVDTNTMISVLVEVERAHEMVMQRKNGVSMLDPAMPQWEKLGVLVEEVGEVATALLTPYDVASGKPAKHDLETELVQTAAMAMSWLQALRER